MSTQTQSRSGVYMHMTHRHHKVERVCVHGFHTATANRLTYSLAYIQILWCKEVKKYLKERRS